MLNFFFQIDVSVIFFFISCLLALREKRRGWLLKQIKQISLFVVGKFVGNTEKKKKFKIGFYLLRF